jgi:hypothetical protein
MLLTLAILIGFAALTGYGLYKAVKEDKNILIKAGTWMVLKPQYRHDIEYSDAYEFVRLRNNYTKRHQNETFYFIYADHFEPAGRLNQQSISIKLYETATPNETKMLEAKYGRELNRQNRNMNAVRAKALKAFGA